MKYRVPRTNAAGERKLIEQLLSFGVYPNVSLAQARAQQQAAREMIKAGNNPANIKRDVRRLFGLRSAKSPEAQLIEHLKRETRPLVAFSKALEELRDLIDGDPEQSAIVGVCTNCGFAACPSARAAKYRGRGKITGLPCAAPEHVRYLLCEDAWGPIPLQGGRTAGQADASRRGPAIRYLDEAGPLVVEVPPERMAFVKRLCGESHYERDIDNVWRRLRRLWVDEKRVDDVGLRLVRRGVLALDECSGSLLTAADQRGEDQRVASAVQELRKRLRLHRERPGDRRSASLWHEGQLNNVVHGVLVVTGTYQAAKTDEVESMIVANSPSIDVTLEALESEMRSRVAANAYDAPRPGREASKLVRFRTIMFAYLLEALPADVDHGAVAVIGHGLTLAAFSDAPNLAASSASLRRLIMRRSRRGEV